MWSLVILVFTNVLLQPRAIGNRQRPSSSPPPSGKYAGYLGGSATFSGLDISIPTAISGMSLVPLVRRDGDQPETAAKGTYKFAHLCCATALIGSIPYALAYRAHYLYLILIGRIVMGVFFAQFMYTEHCCTDPRIVGVRRRTKLTGWLVVGRSAGLTVGPFVGGDRVREFPIQWNTGPGWGMAAVWLVFWAVIAVAFEDVRPRRISSLSSTKMQSLHWRSPPSRGTTMETTTLPSHPCGVMGEEAALAPPPLPSHYRPNPGPRTAPPKERRERRHTGGAHLRAAVGCHRDDVLVRG